MDSRIYEKLNEIKDLDDRVLLKKIMNNVFSSLVDYSKERFDEIEERVFNEVDFIREKYNVYSSIINREDIDPTDDFLYPILQEDIDKPIYKTKEILNSFKENKPYTLLKLFLKCDHSIFREFLNSNLEIKGVIETDKKAHEAYFKISKNKEYINKVEELYKSFVHNNIEWTTINNPYIHKIVDVILLRLKDEIEDDENIINIKVKFGEYDKYVKYNMVPVWNIKELKLKSSGFPTPCIDKVNYEHKLSVEKEGKENGYLVNCDNENIKYITFKKESIIIASEKSESLFCKIYKFITFNTKRFQEYEYDLMSNEVNINFSNKLSFQRRYTIKTKTELARVINSFKASKYLKFRDLKLEKPQNKSLKETYDVNEFIIDEIREEDIRKILVLYFEPLDKENYLNKDILSFLVSEVQFIYPEYECEGRLI